MFVPFKYTHKLEICWRFVTGTWIFEEKHSKHRSLSRAYSTIAGPEIRQATF